MKSYLLCLESRITSKEKAENTTKNSTFNVLKCATGPVKFELWLD